MTTSHPASDPALAERLLGGEPLVVGPPAPLARAVVRALPAEGSARLLLTDAAADGTFGEFLTATAAAEAVADGRLAVRRAAGLDESVTVTADAAYAHVDVGGRFDAVSVTDPDTVAALARANERRWAAAARLPVDAPPRSRLLDSLAAEWPEAGATLAAALDAVDALPDDGALDPVELCALVGARHGLLSMELGEWARGIDFSSRTEIARAKSRLVEAGLVDTRRVPAGVGRPRQRLVLADESLGDLRPAALVDAARDRLAGE